MVLGQQYSSVIKALGSNPGYGGPLFYELFTFILALTPPTNLRLKVQ